MDRGWLSEGGRKIEPSAICIEFLVPHFVDRQLKQYNIRHMAFIPAFSEDPPPPLLGNQGVRCARRELPLRTTTSVPQHLERIVPHP